MIYFSEGKCRMCDCDFLTEVVFSLFIYLRGSDLFTTLIFLLCIFPTTKPSSHINNIRNTEERAHVTERRKFSLTCHTN